MRISVRIFKDKRFWLIAAAGLLAVLAVIFCVTRHPNLEPPPLYLSSESSKTAQAVRGGYSWTDGHKSIIADSISPREFRYSDENTLTLERGVQFILSNRKRKIDRRYPFELSALSCSDKNGQADAYQASPINIDGDLYLDAPFADGVYICSAILRYRQGTVDYGYKLVVSDTAAKVNALYANKTAYVGDNSRVAAIVNNLAVPSRLSFAGLELQTGSEPYGLTIDYLDTAGNMEKSDRSGLQDLFRKNAAVMFSLIGNVDKITVNLEHDDKAESFAYSRKEADVSAGRDVRDLASTEESFADFLSGSEPLAYSLTGVFASVAKRTVPAAIAAADLEAAAKECGTKSEAGHFTKLAAEFAGTDKIIYDFKYAGDSQDGGVFKVTLLPNKPGYASIEQFKKDFGVCAVAGDAYPLILNHDWLLFVSACGSGVDDGSGRAQGCDEVRKVVEPSLRLN